MFNYSLLLRVFFSEKKMKREKNKQLFLRIEGCDNISYNVNMNPKLI